MGSGNPAIQPAEGGTSQQISFGCFQKCMNLPRRETSISLRPCIFERIMMKDARISCEKHSAVRVRDTGIRMDVAKLCGSECTCITDGPEFKWFCPI